MGAAAPLLVRMRSRLVEPAPIRGVYDGPRCLTVVKEANELIPAVLRPDGEALTKTLPRRPGAGED